MYIQSSKPLNILLISNDAKTVSINCKMLECFGHTVNCVNPTDEVSKQAINNYDCILIDINLRDNYGTEFAETIIRQSTNKYHHIIAITSYLISENSYRCKKLGINQILKQPILPDILQEAVTNTL